MKHDPERLLVILHGTIRAAVRADLPDLAARQMALLLIVGMEPGLHTVRGLAARLCISRPAASRSLDRLRDLGLTRRVADLRDGRSVLVELTEAGHRHVANLRGLLRQAARPTRAPGSRRRPVAARPMQPELAA